MIGKEISWIRLFLFFVAFLVVGCTSGNSRTSESIVGVSEIINSDTTSYETNLGTSTATTEPILESPSPSPIVPTSTPSPSPSPTPFIFVESGTPIPSPLPPISIINAQEVSNLAEFYVDELTDLKWMPDGSSIAAATTNKIELFDVYTRVLWRNLHPETEGVRQIAISPSGRWLISGSMVGDLEYGYITNFERWYGLDMKPLGVFATEYRGMSDMEFSANELILFTAFTSPREAENSIEFWNTIEWGITSTMKSGTVLDLSISNFGEKLATSPDRYAINIWDLYSAGEPINTFYTAFTDAVTAGEFSPDGTKLATTHYDGSINIWDVTNGVLLNTMDAGSVVQSLAFSPDGSLLATGNSYQDHIVNIWWVDAGSLIKTLEGHHTGVDYVLWSPNGDMIISGSYDGEIRIWGIRP